MLAVTSLSSDLLLEDRYQIAQLGCWPVAGIYRLGTHNSGKLWCRGAGPRQLRRGPTDPRIGYASDRDAAQSSVGNHCFLVGHLCSRAAFLRRRPRHRPCLCTSCSCRRVHHGSDCDRFPVQPIRGATAAGVSCTGKWLHVSGAVCLFPIAHISRQLQRSGLVGRRP